MKKFFNGSLVILLIVAFFIHLLALMKLVPFLLSVPLLFFSIFILIVNINERKRFKGF
ncbi:hypothetical protein RCG23_06135 [Neobacillus sp. PS3-34]|uniref:hypothetical protein n=1 Tax=Neobacillus sp. PS3-34 TaxID=3070678 RepID=UPI0027E12E69|nr:hypothetical protein [Neobacillus sp. PS3-34]WML49557.1 hypothetical protein RCG23_06135 [Neobacillus sp. PS3-34]